MEEAGPEGRLPLPPPENALEDPSGMLAASPSTASHNSSRFETLNKTFGK
jgi:hypothetical protein